MPATLLTIRPPSLGIHVCALSSPLHAVSATHPPLQIHRGEPRLQGRLPPRAGVAPEPPATTTEPRPPLVSARRHVLLGFVPPSALLSQTGRADHRQATSSRPSPPFAGLGARSPATRSRPATPCPSATRPSTAPSSAPVSGPPSCVWVAKWMRVGPSSPEQSDSLALLPPLSPTSPP